MTDQWYVLSTNPKCEWRAERSLRRAGFKVFLPERKLERRHKRTKKWITTRLCLMPRYLFIRMPRTGADWYGVRACDGVHSVLGFQGKPLPITATWTTDRTTGEKVYEDNPVERLIAMQDNLEFDDTRDAKIRRREIGRNRRETVTMRFPKGTEVRAKSGPFKSFGGAVMGVTARGEVEAMLDLFGRMTPVAFPAEHLETVDDSHEQDHLSIKSA